MAFENCPFEVTPYEKSNVVKTPKLVNVNYTNQDFWSMKSRLIDFIKEKFSDSFNDFVESDLAIMLIENWAFLADTLSFKIDQIANEIFIDTVSEVDNAFRLALLVGFKPQPPIGAKSLWAASINNVLDTDLFIDTPVEISVNTEDGLKTIELFAGDSDGNPLFDEQIIISQGTFLNTSVVGLEGRTITQSGTGSGEINQFIQLSTGPVIWNSVRVTVDGNEWTQVDYFTDSQPRKEFRIEYDPNYNGYIIFGNNQTGLIPSIGSQIFISYRVGGGVAGNIVTGSVDYQKNYSVAGFDFRVPVAFRNYTKGEFGYSGDTIEDIKKKLPAWLRTQNRCVSGDDIETFADQFATNYNGQVGKAKAVLRQHGCAANVIDLYVLTKDEGEQLIESSIGLKKELQDALETKKMLTDSICIKNGVVLETDVYIDVTLDKFYRKFEEEFREKIERRVNSFFALTNWDYGKNLKTVDLIKSLSDILEISNIEITLQTDNQTNSGEIITTRYYEIIRPSVISISFVYN